MRYSINDRIFKRQFDLYVKSPYQRTDFLQLSSTSDTSGFALKI